MSGKGNWRLYLGLIVVSTAVIVLLNTTGVLDKGVEKLAEKPPPEPQEVVTQMPPGQSVLLGLAAILWIGGVNILFVWQARKAGARWWSAFIPHRSGFRHFDARAWRLFGLLTLAAIVLGLAALQISPPA